jgi:cell division protein FtsW
VFTDVGQDRISSYIGGLQNPELASDHVQRALEAIMRGGTLGVGIGKGISKFTVPFPWTDSIYAVIVEETGLAGAVFVLGLYVVILWRGLAIAQRAPDQLGSLLASGLTVWIVLEALINMGVMVSLVPFAGNALPLVTAGGSNMVTSLASLGIVMSVARQSRMIQGKKERKLASAAVDLRRWDGRRRLSRSERHSSIRK